MEYVYDVLYDLGKLNVVVDTLNRNKVVPYCEYHV